MKPMILILSATLLSAPALAQQTTTPTAAKSPVVKKRTPSLTLEGPGQVFKSTEELERDDLWTAAINELNEKEAELQANTQRRQEDRDEARRLAESRLVHHKAAHRPSPFRRRH